MKLKSLPKVHIKNAFSVCPAIKVKVNKFWLSTKIFIVTLLIVLAAAGAYVVNVQHNMAQETAAKIVGANEAASHGTGIVIDTTANIIVRDGGGKVSIELAKKYAIWIYDASIKFNVDPVTILAIMRHESQFNYKAVSPTGPVGLLQIASSFHTDKASKEELFDPKKNIFVGAQIMAEYGARTRNEAEMLVRYNAQPGYAPIYAMKVLATKRKYDNEITDAIVNNV